MLFFIVGKCSLDRKKHQGYYLRFLCFMLFKLESLPQYDYVNTFPNQILK